MRLCMYAYVCACLGCWNVSTCMESGAAVMCVYCVLEPVVFLEAASGLLANSDPKMAACKEIRKGSKWPYGGR